MKKKFKEFIEHLNEKHPTIKFTAEWSQTSINFLDVTVSLIGGKINTDLYVKPTDSHQYLHSSSCHQHHCKKGIPYSQALHFNRICSDPSSFDKRCKELEKWLIERCYSQREVRKQVLRARSFSRDSLLDKESTRMNKKKTLNLTYYPAFQNVKKILAELHLLLPLMLPIKLFLQMFQQLDLKMTVVSKITLFRLCYPILMWKADPNHMGEKTFL